MTELIEFDVYADIKTIVYSTIIEHPDIDESIDVLLCAEEIAERILDYLRASEGIPV